MIRIDGSHGEGGGQILRTSLALSACTGRPFQIENIRSGRKKPGLMRQHLTCVNAVTQICSAQLKGAEIGSQYLQFVPGKVKPGDYHFAVGTAGSSMLVLQTILPPLMIAGAESQIQLEGGTHNPMSPTFNYIDEVFLPVLKKMGFDCSCSLEKWGFYPAGGGKLLLKIIPCAGEINGLELNSRGNLEKAVVVAAVSRIPREIADDESYGIINAAAFEVHEKKILTIDSPGPGNVAMLRLDFENVSAMFTGFGELGVSRKKVAANVYRPANKFFRSKAVVDEHLADQILIPMALAGSGSFVTTEPSLHTLTNMEVIEKFLPVKSSSIRLDKEAWKIEIAGIK